MRVYINTQDRIGTSRPGDGQGSEARLIEHASGGGSSFAALDKASLMEANSRKLIRMLERDGWVLERVNGDHHTFKHPDREAIITVTHPRRDLPIGLVRRIYKLAGRRP